MLSSKMTFSDPFGFRRFSMCCVWAVSGLHRSWEPPCSPVLVWARTGSKSFRSASCRPLHSRGSSVCEKHLLLIVLSALTHPSMLCTLGVHWWRSCLPPTVIYLCCLNQLIYRLSLAGNASSRVIMTVVSHRVWVARMLTHHLNEKS